jgi:hypothetical protein
MAGDRAGGAEYAERVNAAADLAEAGVPVAEAARMLAGRFGCSQRQARRYAERAARAGRVEAPQATTVFTVKLPAGLAAAVREHARLSGRTISAVVAQAVEEFLARGRREPPRR